MSKMIMVFIIHGLVNFYNMFMAVQLYLDGQLAYFITYISIMGITKIFVVLCRMEFQYRAHFIVLGFFDLEFISALFSKSIHDEYKHCICVLNQFISTQFLFFYCFGVLDNSGINDYIIACQYLNYILSTFNITFYLLAESEEYFNLSESIIISVKRQQWIHSYTFTIISLTFFKDNNGINLGYYCLIFISIIQILLIIIYFSNRNILKFMKLQEFFICIIGCNLIANFKYQLEDLIGCKIKANFKSNLEGSIGNALSLLNSIGKFILLLKFGVFRLDEFLLQEQNPIYGKIKFLVTFSALFYNLIYILILLIILFRFIVRQRHYSILKIQDFDKVIDKLTNNSRLINFYKVYFLFNENSLSKEQNNEKQLTLFWKAVSVSMQKQNIIKFKINEGSQLIMNLDILTEVEIIHDFLLSQLDYQIQELNSIDYLIVKRIENGFVNESTIQLLNRQNVRKKKQIKKIICQTLQINSFYKHLSSSMLYNPASILYDLFGEQQIDIEEEEEEGGDYDLDEYFLL